MEGSDMLYGYHLGIGWVLFCYEAMKKKSQGKQDDKERQPIPCLDRCAAQRAAVGKTRDVNRGGLPEVLRSSPISGADEEAVLPVYLFDSTRVRFQQ